MNKCKIDRVWAWSGVKNLLVRPETKMYTLLTLNGFGSLFLYILFVFSFILRHQSLTLYALIVGVLRTRAQLRLKDGPLRYWVGLWKCSLHTAGSHLWEILHCTATQNTFKKGHNPQFKGIYSRAFHHIHQNPFSRNLPPQRWASCNTQRLLLTKSTRHQLNLALAYF